MDATLSRKLGAFWWGTWRACQLLNFVWSRWRGRTPPELVLCSLLYMYEMRADAASQSVSCCFSMNLAVLHVVASITGHGKERWLQRQRPLLPSQPSGSVRNCTCSLINTDGSQGDSCPSGPSVDGNIILTNWAMQLVWQTSGRMIHETRR